MKLIYINKLDVDILFEEMDPQFIPIEGDIINHNEKIYEVSHRHRVDKYTVEVYVSPAM